MSCFQKNHGSNNSDWHSVAVHNEHCKNNHFSIAYNRLILLSTEYQQIAKMKKRKLGTSLTDLLGIDKSSYINSINTPAPPLPEFEGLTIYGVIRSKGGSGEKHIVKKLSQDLIASGKKVFICYKNTIESDDYLLKHFLPREISVLINPQDISLEGNGGVINLNWWDNNCVIEVFKKIKKIKGATIIITCGTDTAGYMYERIRHLQKVCDKIFIPIDSHVHFSVEPAIDICEASDLNTEKLISCWWHKVRVNGDTQHLLGIIPASDVSKENEGTIIEYVKNKTNEQNNDSLVPFLTNLDLC
ncbi:MAG TPA: hypothetical protein DIT74_13760 [Pseudoalteromonas sp.]|nr:hypothetical protein [Pseudoalteromonas sp.]|tara:strand:- start:2805 stop:3707 length:903 start_codon:yes stop_codon:yes gene_type:complete